MADSEIPCSQEWDNGPREIVTWDYLNQVQKEKSQQRKIERQFNILQRLQPLTREFSSLPETTSRKTRDHGFYQRHVYTTDLAEYLDISSRSELEKAAKKGKTDDQIIYMLNRKYVKIRRFYEKHDISRHRFKKKNFSVYLEDFKKYQSNGGGTRFYENIEDTLKSSKERKQLAKLHRKSLGNVSTTEEEESEHEQVDDAQHQQHSDEEQLMIPRIRHNQNNEIMASQIDETDDNVVLLVSDQHPRNDTEGDGRIQSLTPPINNNDCNNNDNNNTSDIFDFPDEGQLSTHPSSQIHSPSNLDLGVLSNDNKETDDEHNDSNVDSLERSDQADQSNKTGTQELLRTVIDNSFIPSRRTRRHKFSQDHIYIADKVYHLGLSSIPQLNQMYENGKSYREIMDYLEECWAKKRAYREKKEIGYGPYREPTFQAYIEGETKTSSTANTTLAQPRHGKNTDDDSQDFVQNDINLPVPSSDDEYVYHGNDLDDNVDELNTSKFPNWRPRSERKEPRRQLPNTIEDESQTNSNIDTTEDAFVFRKKVYKKSRALRGVLPASFFRLNPGKPITSKAVSISTQIEKAAKPGVARTKKVSKYLKSSDYDGMKDFLAADDDVSHEEVAPRPMLDIDVSYSADQVETYRESSPEINDIEDALVMSSASSDNDSEDDIGIRDYDRYRQQMKFDMDMDGLAEEDNHTGIDYMLGSRSREKNPVSSSAVRQGNSVSATKRKARKGSMSLANSKRARVGARIPRSNPQRFSYGKRVTASTRPYVTARYQKSISDFDFYNNYSSIKAPSADLDDYYDGPMYISDEENYPNVFPTGTDSLKGFDLDSFQQENALVSSFGKAEAKSGPPSAFIQSYSAPKSQSFNLGTRIPSTNRRSYQTKQQQQQQLSHPVPQVQVQSHSRPLKIHSQPHNYSKSKFNVLSNSNNLADIEGIRKPDTPTRKPHFTLQQKNTIKADNQFYFRRQRIVGTAQLEGVLRSSYNSYHDYNYQQNGDDGDLVQYENGGDDLHQLKSYRNTVDKLEKAAFMEDKNRVDDLGQVSLRRFANLELKPNYFICSNLFSQSINEEGDYYKPGSIVFEFGTIRFTIDSSNTGDSAKLVETLMKNILIALRKSDVNSDDHVKLRQCYIKLVQLTWNLYKLDYNELKRFAKIMVMSTRSFLDYVGGSPSILLYAPYHLLMMHLLARFLRNEMDDNYQFNYELLATRITKNIILSVCSLSPTRLNSYLNGSHDSSVYYLESMSVFTAISRNPWQYMASVASEYRLSFVNVVNFLFFLHSREPVLVDWEYFIYEVNNLKESKDAEKCKMVFEAIKLLIDELHWFFEEELLVKMYRFMSSKRFENIGNGKSGTVWYSSLPKSTAFTKVDGCLDMYFKLSVIYVNNYMEPDKQNSLIEKLTPIGDIKTSTLELLKNRANVLLVMTMLFNRDLLPHFKNILKVLLSFQSPEAFKAALEILLVTSKCYLNEFKKIPFGIINGCLPKIIDSINKNSLLITGITESFKVFTDFFEYHATHGEPDKSKMVSILDISVIILKLRKIEASSRLFQIPMKVIGIIQWLLHNSGKLLLKQVESKLKNEVVTSFKSIILSNDIKSENLRIKCIFCWVQISALLDVNVDALIHLEWIYFGDETVRSRFEMHFYSAVLKYYQPETLSGFHDNFFLLLVQNIPMLVNPGFFQFFQLVTSMPSMKDYIIFRNGMDPSRFSEYEFRQQKQRVTVKILARIVVEMRIKDKEPVLIEHLKQFLIALNKEYWRQKDLDVNYLSYKGYAAHIIQYLNTVVKHQVGGISEFITLRHELSLNEAVAPMNERFESLSNADEFVIMVETEYITSVIYGRLSTFEEEFVDSIFDLNSMEKESHKSSPLYLLVLIISLHVDYIQRDTSHWVHLKNWMEIIVKIIKCKSTFGESDTWCLIKLLTSLSKLKDKREAYHSSSSTRVVELSYEVMNVVSLSLVGFDDRSEFKEILKMLLPIENEYISGSGIKFSGSLSTSELEEQFRKLYKDHDVILKKNTVVESISPELSLSRIMNSNVIFFENMNGFDCSVVGEERIGTVPFLS